MIIGYEMADENAQLAARIYAERFPNRERHPSSKAIRRCPTGDRKSSAKLRSTGTSQRREEEVLRMFDENPGTSVRRAARALGLLRCMVHRILRRNNLRPYHYQRVQQLLERDEAPRVHFCEGIYLFFLLESQHFFAEIKHQ